MQLFCDMDGVLADFDSHYEAMFGERPSRLLDNADWNKVRVCKDFYLNIPPMPDMRELWEAIAPYNPVLLTGIPYSVAEAAANKMAWAHRHLPNVEVHCCRSSEKWQHAKPGDILIDDWDKYRLRWESAGGVWITHLSAAQTIKEFKAIVTPGDTHDR